GGGPDEARKACAEVLGVGAAAVPLLRQLSRDPDRPGATLARRCLQHLEEKPGALSSAVVRLTALRRPAGAASALLAFMPHADNEVVLGEVRDALAAVAYRNGRPDPDLVAALDDTLAVRRAAAVAALCGNRLRAPVERLRKALRDPSPFVRL